MVTAISREGDPLLGEVIADKYSIVSLLARGGMGRVYRGVQLALEREVALKVLDLRLLVQSGTSEAVVDDFRRRFVLEAASAAKLTHPNTIVIHDYGVEGDDLLYMVMELVEGQTLAQRLDQDGRLPPETVVRIMAQVCGSLAEAHGRGMVHRDLKPSNIMLTQRGSQREFVKVLDFGLVKKEEDVSSTRSGALIGTPRYMSPEQIANSEVTAASDVYGLGACMYHALTGQPPFDSESAYVLMAAHINARPPAMADVDASLDVPAALERVVMRCLSKAPEDRYASMEDVSIAMQEALGDDFTLSGARSLLPSGSTPLGRLPSKDWTESLTDSGARLPDASVSTVSPPRRRALVALLALLGVVLLGVAFASLTGRPPAAAPAPVPEVTGRSAEAVSADARVEVWVRSTPEGARVTRGDEDLGNTPARLLLAPEERWTLTLSAPGREERTLRVSTAQREVNVVLEPVQEPLDGAEPRERAGSAGRPRVEGSRLLESEGSAAPSGTVAARMGSAASSAMAGSDTPSSAEGGGPVRRTDNRDPWDTP